MGVLQTAPSILKRVVGDKNHGARHCAIPVYIHTPLSPGVIAIKGKAVLNNYYSSSPNGLLTQRPSGREE